VLSNTKGVSCVLLCTEKGERAFEQCAKNMYTLESGFEKAARHNSQLCFPSTKSPRRQVILDLYKNNGYGAVENYFRKNFIKDIVVGRISWYLPRKFKKSIKRIFRINK